MYAQMLKPNFMSLWIPWTLKRIVIKEYYEQLCAPKFDNVDEISIPWKIQSSIIHIGRNRQSELDYTY